MVEASSILSLVTGAAGATKAVAEAIKSLRSKAKDPETQQALVDAQEELLSIRSQILEIQEVALGLQEENAQLREEIRQHDDWAAEREKYEIRKVGRDAAVLPKGEDEPLYCPNCFHSGKLSVLGSTGMTARMPSHVCGICESTFKLGSFLGR